MAYNPPIGSTYHVYIAFWRVICSRGAHSNFGGDIGNSTKKGTHVFVDAISCLAGRRGEVTAQIKQCRNGRHLDVSENGSAWINGDWISG